MSNYDHYNSVLIGTILDEDMEDESINLLDFENKIAELMIDDEGSSPMEDYVLCLQRDDCGGEGRSVELRRKVNKLAEKKTKEPKE